MDSGVEFQRAVVHHAREDTAMGRESVEQAPQADTSQGIRTQEAESGHKASPATCPSDPLPPASLHLLKVPQPLQQLYLCKTIAQV